MSMFICARCDGFRDSDDGCEEYQGTKLICIDCMNDAEDEEPINTDMSYDGIFKKLVSMGCPEDIAHELAREKSK